MSEPFDASTAFEQRLGISSLDLGPRAVRARLEWSPALCGRGATLHAAAIGALAHTAAEACASVTPCVGGGAGSAIESKTTFFAAVGQEDHYAEAVARPLHVGARVIVVEVDILDATSRLVARTSQSQVMR